MPNPKVVFQAIFQSAVRECERNTLVDLLQKKSPNSTTEAHKHAVLDSGPRTCATITDTNHLYLLFLNCCYFLDLTIKLTHMFSIISRYFLLIPSLMPSLWTANTPFIPPPPVSMIQIHQSNSSRFRRTSRLIERTMRILSRLGGGGARQVIRAEETEVIRLGIW